MLGRRDLALGGHDGARRFYAQLLTAFPDIHFDLIDIVVGPQGVFQFAEVTATHEAPWLDTEPDGRRHRWQTAILFPWDPAVERFSGEKVFSSPSAPGA